MTSHELASVVEAIGPVIARSIQNATSQPQRIAYTIDEAATSLGVTRRTVEGLIDRGELKSRLVGKHRLVSLESLRKLLA